METGTKNLSKNLKEDKSIPLSLLDSIMDMLMMDSLPPLMQELLKPSLCITITSVENIKSIKLTTLLRSPESCMEDTRMTTMEEETLGFFLPEDLLIFSTEPLYTLKKKEPISP